VQLCPLDFELPGLESRIFKKKLKNKEKTLVN